ncbi:hypothetical protein SAMN05660284_00528 [Formivibrio citricus]|uniref:Uncharacterized protein n=1 Tax=Formivibrio citricus TaxID=83765 RepID=A0A1I4WAD4_9NEIS|nr:hypothetical protein SAMN05660284_00528 [Formivibrio citricus]
MQRRALVLALCRTVDLKMVSNCQLKGRIFRPIARWEPVLDELMSIQKSRKSFWQLMVLWSSLPPGKYLFTARRVGLLEEELDRTEPTRMVCLSIFLSRLLMGKVVRFLCQRVSATNSGMPSILTPTANMRDMSLILRRWQNIFISWMSQPRLVVQVFHWPSSIRRICRSSLLQSAGRIYSPT